jgi:hypothetical protein
MRYSISQSSKPRRVLLVATVCESSDLRMQGRADARKTKKIFVVAGGKGVFRMSTTILSYRSQMQKLPESSALVDHAVCYQGRQRCDRRFSAPACCAKHMHSVSSRGCEGVGETTSLIVCSILTTFPNGRADSNCIQQHSGITS